MERQTLIISMIGAFALAAWGIGMAHVSASQAIFLDGMFNLISGVLSFISIWVTSLVQQRHSREYPLGFFAYESLFIVVKGSSILVLVVMAVTASVQIMLAGGRDPQLGLMTVYVGPAVLGCALLTFITRRGFQRTGSEILHAESEAWLINAVVSAAVGAAFIGAILAEGTRFAWTARYVDQVLVILCSLIFIRDPVILFRAGFRELMLTAPDRDYVSPIRAAVLPFVEEHNVLLRELDVMKMGRKTWVTLFVDTPEDQISIDALMQFKESAKRVVREIHENASVEVILDRPLPEPRC